MSKVQLKMSPWLASVLELKAPGSGWFILEREIREGATVGDLLAELASSYNGFSKVVFDPAVGEVSDPLMLLLNDNLMPESNITQIKLSDGDSIMLMDVVAGG